MIEKMKEWWGMGAGWGECLIGSENPVYFPGMMNISNSCKYMQSKTSVGKCMN